MPVTPANLIFWIYRVNNKRKPQACAIFFSEPFPAWAKNVPPATPTSAARRNRLPRAAPPKRKSASPANPPATTNAPPSDSAKSPKPAFTHKALNLEFAVCRPHGDSERYDAIVDSREPNIMPKLSRVQVKCSTQMCDGLYRTNAHRRIHGRAVPYKPTEIDFIAAYIIPEDTWYIIPIRAVRGTSLLFRPKRSPKRSLYHDYREAWHLLRQTTEKK